MSLGEIAQQYRQGAEDLREASGLVQASDEGVQQARAVLTDQRKDRDRVFAQIALDSNRDAHAFSKDGPLRQLMGEVAQATGGGRAPRTADVEGLAHSSTAVLDGLARYHALIGEIGLRDSIAMVQELGYRTSSFDGMAQTMRAAYELGKVSQDLGDVAVNLSGLAQQADDEAGRM